MAAQLDLQEFKFPDEVENKEASTPASEQQTPQVEESDVELEIVDDTPPQDRGRKPLEKEPEEVTDSELEQYSQSVQKRIKDLTHARHDERRAKEAVLREKQELERFAQQLLEDNKKLRTTAIAGAKAYAGSVKDAAQAEYEIAKKRFREAHEAFDPDQILEAQELLTKAQLKLERAQAAQPEKDDALQQEQTPVYQQPTEQVSVPKPDEKALRWQANNSWFGSDEEMTALAFALHKKLVHSGIDPRSDEYYAQIDAGIRKRFPENFEEPAKHAEPKKAAPVVAPATRSTGAKKVSLTQTQVALARKFGLTPEAYAKEVLKLENVNG
jgi:hypothetical protein